MSESSKYPEILTMEQAAEYLQFSIRTMQRLVKNKEIPGRQIGKQWRFHRDQLRDWVRGKDFKPEKSTTQAELIKLWADKTGLDLPQSLIDLQQEAVRRNSEDR